MFLNPCSLFFARTGHLTRLIWAAEGASDLLFRKSTMAAPLKPIRPRSNTGILNAAHFLDVYREDSRQSMAVEDLKPPLHPGLSVAFKRFVRASSFSSFAIVEYLLFIQRPS